MALQEGRERGERNEILGQHTPGLVREFLLDLEAMFKFRSDLLSNCREVLPNGMIVLSTRGSQQIQTIPVGNDNRESLCKEGVKGERNKILDISQFC